MGPLHYLKRVSQASPKELAFRLNQKLHEQFIRLKHATGGDLSVSSSLLKSIGVDPSEAPDWFQLRGNRWFMSGAKIADLQRFFDSNPTCRRELVDRAESIVHGEMPALGHGLIAYSGDDRWRRDPISGTTAPDIFYGDIAYLDPACVGDSKNVWEPNRFGWAYSLGAAYVATDDRRYFDSFRNLTHDWFLKNPYPRGVNYCSSLEIAFRCYAWVWACDLFKNELSEDPELLQSLIAAIWTGTRHVDKNLSYYFAPNTHLTGEAFALFAVGCAFPEFSEAKRWRAIGNRILAAGSAKQFHQDGTHRELSSCYHLYSTDFYLQAALIADQTGFPIDPVIRKTAERCARRLAELVTFDLRLPQFNDCDGGRLTWFGHEPLNAGPTLLAARTIWTDITLPGEPVPCNGYHLWMSRLSDDENHATPKPASVSSERAVTFDLPPTNDSGIATYSNRSGDYLLFRSGPFGYMDCGHSHDALLGCLLQLGGTPVIVDSGTGSYTESIETRNRFRSARGKNALLVDGTGPSIPDGWFNWKRKSDARLIRAGRFSGGFDCEGEHTAFTAAMGFPVKISRRLALFDNGVFLVVDRWQAEQPIHCSLAWTIHPGMNVAESNGEITLEDREGGSYHVASFTLATMSNIRIGSEVNQQPESAVAVIETCDRMDNASLELSRIHYSPAYGIVSETSCIQSDFSESTTGCVLTCFSRAGKVEVSRNDTARATILSLSNTQPSAETSATIGNHESPKSTARVSTSPGSSCRS